MICIQHYFTNKKVLITGELKYFKTRNELAKLLWDNGAIIEKTFNNTINVLIVGKSNIDSLKLKNAYYQNIKVITEEELLNYFPDFKPIYQ
ncbi:MAG: BRCT domain-containing protein [Flavobacteriaceae bacterium]|nr:BRCT domain-containing protein [Flavobacteriaceae bacterium]